MFDFNLDSNQTYSLQLMCGTRAAVDGNEAKIEFAENGSVILLRKVFEEVQSK